MTPQLPIALLLAQLAATLFMTGLVRFNWIRTLAWTARAILLLAALAHGL